MTIAYITETVGRYVELIAQSALLANGWQVHESQTKEAYDALIMSPEDGRIYKVQIKTIRKRDDRRGELVVYAKKGNGTTYDLAEADYIIGVLALNGEIPKVYMFPNSLIGEYWCAESRVNERWTELPLSIDREVLTCG